MSVRVDRAKYYCTQYSTTVFSTVCTYCRLILNVLKGAVREIGKLGSNGTFFDADPTDMDHFGLSGFYSGVLVHQSIAPQSLEENRGRSCLMTVRVDIVKYYCTQQNITVHSTVQCSVQYVQCECSTMSELHHQILL